ncbi:MAG TPA: sugar phosphate isomerase/epimerase [Firmicutes bacterium]|nr:sugar phosphate isomerase/epimerase [Bacillota bacterium]
MHLSFFTDEAHDNFAEALKLAEKWGLKWAEIRTIDGVNVMDLPDEPILRAKKLLDDHGISVSAVATPFLKCRLPGTSPASSGPMHGARELSYEDHLKMIPRGVELAQIFGTNRIRLFSFWRVEHPDFWKYMNEAVAAALEAAEGTGVVPCLENEGACCIGTSAELAEAAGRLTDPRLKLIWDPGNSTGHGMVPRDEDWPAISARLGLVHVKDSRYNAALGKREPTPPGEGETNYRKELARIASAYDGPITLEPHYRPGGDMTEGMRQCVEAIRRLADELQLELK